jgi:two-component system sensor histidine kinase/response regulator
MAKVLVVDDDVTILSLERQVLEREKYEVVTASSGTKALELLRTQAFGLVLLDITMPGEVDGFAVARALRADPQNARTPVIFISGRTDAEATREAFKSGGSLFLSKPFNALQLARLVKTLVR